MHINPEPMRTSRPKRSGRKYQPELYAVVPKAAAVPDKPVAVEAEQGDLHPALMVLAWAMSTVLMYPVWKAVIPALIRLIER